MKHLILFLSVFLLIGRAPAQNGISIGAGGGVEYVITDPLQRRAGINPIVNQRYREINNSYGVYSVDSEDPDVDPPEPVNEFMTHDPVNGVYHLTLYGTKLARYRLSILVDAQNKGKAVVLFGMIDSNQVRKLEFEYSSDSAAPFLVRKITISGTLKEDLMNCYKLKLLGNQSVYKEFSNKTAKIERQFGNGDSAKAHDELEKLVKELKKLREETEKHEERRQKPNRFITREAYEILSDDIAILMSSFPRR